MSRRAFAKTLAAAGGSTVLASLTKKTLAAAAGVNAPRFISFITPTGHVPEEFWPKGTPDSYSFGRILKPVEKFKDKLLFLDGLVIRYDGGKPGDQHQQGAGKLLTGANLLNGPYGGAGISPGWSSAASIDQIIAEKLGTQSIYAGVQITRNDTWSRYSYIGRDKPNTPIQNPADLYKMLFSGVTPSAGTPGTPAAKSTYGKATVDFLNADVSRLRAKLAPDERGRLDEHVAFLSKRADQLSKPIAGSSGGTPGCAPPATSMNINYMDNSLHGTVGKLQIDNIVAAARCGISRVAVLQWSQAVSETNFSWLNAPGGSCYHHAMTHYFGGTGGHVNAENGKVAPELFIKASTWYAEQFAYLLSELDKVPEGNGTMLDNSIVFWGTELNGFDHGHLRMPFVVAGGAGAKVKGGRWLKTPVAHNDLLTGIGNAMGVPMTTIGEASYNRTPLSLA
jgi:hypothetical protein